RSRCRPRRAWRWPWSGCRCSGCGGCCARSSPRPPRENSPAPRSGRGRIVLRLTGVKLPPSFVLRAAPAGSPCPDHEPPPTGHQPRGNPVRRVLSWKRLLLLVAVLVVLGSAAAAIHAVQARRQSTGVRKQAEDAAREADADPAKLDQAI